MNPNLEFIRFCIYGSILYLMWRVIWKPLILDYSRWKLETIGEDLIEINISENNINAVKTYHFYQGLVSYLIDDIENSGLTQFVIGIIAYIKKRKEIKEHVYDFRETINSIEDEKLQKKFETIDRQLRDCYFTAFRYLTPVLFIITLPFTIFNIAIKLLIKDSKEDKTVECKEPTHAIHPIETKIYSTDWNRIFIDEKRLNAVRTPKQMAHV